MAWWHSFASLTRACTGAGNRTATATAHRAVGAPGQRIGCPALRRQRKPQLFAAVAAPFPARGSAAILRHVTARGAAVRQTALRPVAEGSGRRLGGSN